MFRKLLTIALPLAMALAPLGASDAVAKSSFKLLPKTSLWAQIPQNAGKDEIKALCDEIVSRQDSSAIGRSDASMLYMHGMIMGVRCLKVDYYKALVYARDSGDAFTFKSAVTYIDGKSRGGTGSAQRALEKFDRENPGLLVKETQ